MKVAIYRASIEALAVLAHDGPFVSPTGRAKGLWTEHLGRPISGETIQRWEADGWIIRDTRGRKCYSVALSADLDPALRVLIDRQVAERWPEASNGAAPHRDDVPAVEQLAPAAVTPEPAPPVAEQPAPPAVTAEDVANALLAEVIARLEQPGAGVSLERLAEATATNERLRRQVADLTETLRAKSQHIEKLALQIRNLQASQRHVDDEVRAKVEARYRQQVATLMRPNPGKRS